MNVASVTAPRWAVSTRTRGELLVAGASTPVMELVLLGAPVSASPAELEDWLRDLAGVAAETARADVHERPIPPLLYHALAGLLFSQAELWSASGRRPPCALAFVEVAEGAAFGWAGEGRLSVHVDGQPVDPQWVRVRDEEGREARAAVLAASASAQVALEYWPEGTPQGEAPASVEAEWRAEGREVLASEIAPSIARTETSAVPEPEPPAEIAAQIGSPFAEVSVDARTGPPGEPEPHEATSENAASAASEAPAAAVTPVESAIATPAEAREVDENLMREWGSLSSEQSDALESLTAPREPHPVARWLGRVFGFARKPQAPLPAGGAPEAEPPVSAYDALLSENVPHTEPVEAPAEPPALPLDAPAAPHSSESPVPVPPAPAPGRDAIAEIESMARLLGGTEVAAGETLVLEPTAAAIEPAAVVREPEPEIAPPPVAEVSPPAPALDSARERLLRAMQAADAGTLPVLHVPLPEPPAESPLQIDREPVGADADAFGIPSLPATAHVESAHPAEPELPRGAGIPPLAEAPPVAHVESESPAAIVPSSVDPAAPAAPQAPPRRFVSGVGTASAPAPKSEPPAGPPMLRIEPGSTPRVIVPTAPVAPVSTTPRAFAPPGAPPRGPWPGLETLAREKAASNRRRWVIGAIVTAALTLGWLLGTFTNPDREGPSPIARFFARLGLGPAHYTAIVNSSPTGAWIAIDGKDAAKRTPAEIDLPPGAHTLTLTLPDLGSADVAVRGARGERVNVAPSLDGGLEIQSSDAGVPITVALDGRPLGYAPVTLEHVAPGLHELQFTGPGMPAWAQTVQVGVRRVEQVVAHPMSAPATGVIEVQATLNDEQGSTPLSGAQVFVDGELRGVTPANLELPRGPHSLKLVWRGSAAPVQVIDLPGGNQRFASFAFGLDTPSPQITLLAGVHPSSAKQTAMVQASLQGLTLGDIREAWLHVRTPEGLWRRFPMTAMRGAGGPVVVCVFPPTAFDSRGSARWYVSAATVQGDEYFSEMQTATMGGGAKPRAGSSAKP